MLAPRQHHLDRDDPGRAKPERSWWKPWAEWPPDMHFENVSRAVLALERRADPGMPRAPMHPGAYGCAAAMAVASRFAEEPGI